MSIWLLVQVAINLALILGLFAVWNIFRKFRNQEDPRMSRGLQLLQSKIAILEDLSDRTETQVRQVTALIENKIREAQEKIDSSDRQLLAIDKSIARSLEVSKIFQDKIPHQEIIERQATAKYIEAARLANRGETIEEISRKVSIPKNELELIVRMNRNQLVFNENEVPEWAKPPVATAVPQDFVPEPNPYETRKATVLSELDSIREQLRNQSRLSFGNASVNTGTVSNSGVSSAGANSANVDSEEFSVMPPPNDRASAEVGGLEAPALQPQFESFVSPANSKAVSAAPQETGRKPEPIIEPAIEFAEDPFLPARNESESAPSEISIAAQVLEEQLQTEAGRTSIRKSTTKFGLRKSSVLPKETKTRPYEFKKIKTERP